MHCVAREDCVGIWPCYPGSEGGEPMASLPGNSGEPDMLDPTALDPSLFDFLPSASGLDWDLDHRDGGAGPLGDWAKDVFAPPPTSGASSSSMHGGLDMNLDEPFFEGDEAEDEEGSGNKKGPSKELVQHTRFAAKEKNRV
jgi:hypothetical protein